jgi:hypothetical protein
MLSRFSWSLCWRDLPSLNEAFQFGLKKDNNGVHFTWWRTGVAAHIVKCTLLSVHCWVYIVKCTLLSVHCWVFVTSVHCWVYITEYSSRAYIVECTLLSVHCWVFVTSVHCWVYVVERTLLSIRHERTLLSIRHERTLLSYIAEYSSRAYIVEYSSRAYIVECTLLSIRHNTGSLERKNSRINCMFYFLCSFHRESFSRGFR